MHSLSLVLASIFEKSQNLSKAEMAFLQAQIVPHFLYNTLNTIIYLTRESPEKARSLLLEFSSYLRGKFDFNMYNQNRLVTLEHELELVKSYLSIELVRFNDRLTVTYQIDPSALNCNIMPFILQPLVENAVRHGLKNRARDCEVTITAQRQNAHILIAIEDNGSGMPKEMILAIINGEAVGSGTGLYNVARRLKETYGETLQITSTMNEGTAIRFRIPVKEVKHAESLAH
jgi:sensor histidine kinase YesM